MSNRCYRRLSRETGVSSKLFDGIEPRNPGFAVGPGLNLGHNRCRTFHRLAGHGDAFGKLIDGRGFSTNEYLPREIGLNIHDLEEGLSFSFIHQWASAVEET